MFTWTGIFNFLLWCNPPSFCLGEKNRNKHPVPLGFTKILCGHWGRVLPKSLNLKATSTHKYFKRNHQGIRHYSGWEFTFGETRLGWLLALTAIFQRKKYIKVLCWLFISNDDWTRFDVALKFYWTIYQNHQLLPLELHTARGKEAIREFHHKNKCHQWFHLLVQERCIL